MADEFRVRQALRAATSGSHERVDGTFGQFDLSDREGYGRFLMAQAVAYLAVEAALDAGGVGSVIPDWAARRRSHLIAQDLAALGLSAPRTDEPVLFEGTASMLGATYVLEGSRLGGALLKRSVPAGFPSGFLDAANPGAWRTLLELLEEQIDSDDDVASATNAARRVFNLFEQSGRRFLKAD